MGAACEAGARQLFRLCFELDRRSNDADIDAVDAVHTTPSAADAVLCGLVKLWQNATAIIPNITKKVAQSTAILARSMAIVTRY